MPLSWAVLQRGGGLCLLFAMLVWRVMWVCGSGEEGYVCVCDASPGLIWKVVMRDSCQMDSHSLSLKPAAFNPLIFERGEG